MRFFKAWALLSVFLTFTACSSSPTGLDRTPQNHGMDGLVEIEGVECHRPLETEWPQINVHIKNDDKKSKGKVQTKSVDLEVLGKNGDPIKSYTMYKGLKTGSMALKPLVEQGPLHLRVTQNFVWKNGKKKLDIRNRVFQGPIDRENFCLQLPEYQPVTASINLSDRFIGSLLAKNLDLSKGYIEAKNQLGELSVDMKVKYDKTRTTASPEVPRVWKTVMIMNANGGSVTFTPSPWSSDQNEFVRQDSVTVEVTPDQKEFDVEIP